MRRAWIILLLVAMLPLHGWAAAAMAVSMAATGPSPETALVSTAAETGQAAVATPCHGSADGSHAGEGTAAPERAPHDCASCHLCHAWVAVLAEGMSAPVRATPVDAPAAYPRDTGRLIAGCLERPPRA
jgi:hypothetical protein